MNPTLPDLGRCSWGFAQEGFDGVGEKGAAEVFVANDALPVEQESRCADLRALLGVVQISQIPGNIICGSIRCGSLKSEGFGDGCAALRVLPSPSCA